MLLDVLGLVDDNEPIKDYLNTNVSHVSAHLVIMVLSKVELHK